MFLENGLDPEAFNLFLSNIAWGWHHGRPSPLPLPPLDEDFLSGRSSSIAHAPAPQPKIPIKQLREVANRLPPAGINVLELQGIADRLDLEAIPASDEGWEDFSILFAITASMSLSSHLPSFQMTWADYSNFVPGDRYYRKYAEYQSEKGSYVPLWARSSQDPKREFSLQWGHRLFEAYRLWLERTKGEAFENLPLKDRIQALLKAFPQPSEYRNKLLIEMTGNHYVREAERQSTITPEETQRLRDPLRAPSLNYEIVFPHLVEGGIKNILAKRIILEKKARGELTLRTYANVKELMKQYFGDGFSDIRRELFNDLLQGVEVTFDELEALEGEGAIDQISRNRTAGIAHVVLEHLADRLEERSPEEKLEIFRWLIGQAPKPRLVEFIEFSFKVDLSSLAYQLRHSSSAERYLFLSTLMIGPKGILNDDVQRSRLISEIYRRGTGEVPDESNLLFLVCKTVFEACSDLKRFDLVFGAFSHILSEEPSSGTGRNEFIRRFLLSFGLIGVKIGQILSKQQAVPPDLRVVLEELSDKVDLLDKRYLLSALRHDKSRHFLGRQILSVGPPLGSASIKQGYKIRKRGWFGKILQKALKYIRPLAHYEIEENLQVLVETVKRLREINQDRILHGRPQIPVLNEISDELLIEIGSAARGELRIDQETSNQRVVGRFARGAREGKWHLEVPRIDGDLDGSQIFR